MTQESFDDIEIVNNSKARRIETQIGDQVAHIDYIPDKDFIIFTRTEVPETIAHHGVAGKMVHFALEYAKSNDLKVIPQCPFVAGYIHIHPKYQSLVWDPKAQNSSSDTN
ncbi:MAG: N-acetyltransferase [Chloroflexi bacterium]|jgi:predicted GNAT family acetyltransferase|nr:N-acetyltransferase [Chloroflexota bacterium]